MIASLLTSLPNIFPLGDSGSVQFRIKEFWKPGGDVTVTLPGELVGAGNNGQIIPTA